MKNPITKLLVLAILIGLTAGAAGCSGASPVNAVGVVGSENMIPDTGSEPVIADDSIIAESSVVPLQSVTLGFTAQGIVSEVLVAEGDTVKAGDVIARLKDSEKLQASVASANLELLNARKALEDLKANYAVSKSKAQLRLAQAQKDLDKAKTQRASKFYKVGSENQIDIADAELLVAKEGVRNAEDMYGTFEELPEDSVNRAAALTNLANARQKRDKAQANLNYLLSKPNQFEVNLAEAQVAVAQAEADAAQRDFNALASGPNATELALAQARVENAEAQLKAAKVALADLELVSPIDGMVVSNDLKKGELIDATSAKVLVANLSSFQVETNNLTEMNVVKINEGTPVEVSFDALPDVTINGKVVRIKSLGTNVHGDITYTVVIGLDKQDQRLRWNMTASSRFVTK